MALEQETQVISSKTFTSRGVIAICLAYLIYKGWDLTRVFSDSILHGRSTWHQDYLPRLGWGALVVVGVLLGLVGLKRQGVLPWFAGLGIGAVLLGLAQASLGTGVTAFGTWILLFAPALTLSVWTRHRIRKTESLSLTQVNTGDSVFWVALKWISFGLVGLFALDQSLRSPLMKLAPSDDELVYGFYALQEMLPRGFSGFLEHFTVSSTPPAWIFFSHQLFGWLPEATRLFAMYLQPATVGVLIFAAALVGEAKSPRASTLAFIVLLLSSIFVQHFWIARMTWYLWYGDAFAALLVGLTLIVMDHRRSDTLTSLPIVIGMGALLSLCKPPFGYLAILLSPMYLVMFRIFADKSLRSSLYVRALCFGFGAVVARLVFNHVFVAAGKGLSSHIFVFTDFLTLNLEGSVLKIFPFLVSSYKNYLIVFPLLVVFALMTNFKRYLPSLLVVLAGMVLIVWLYASFWSAVEHESAARYFLHSIGGWIIFFCVSERHPESELTRTLQSLWPRK